MIWFCYLHCFSGVVGGVGSDIVDFSRLASFSCNALTGETLHSAAFLLYVVPVSILMHD